MSKSTARLSHLYVHLASVGDALACAVLLDEVGSLLEVMDARDDIRGYQLAVINNEEEAEEDFLARMFDYVATTKGQFPFVYALLTPHVPEKVDIDEIMRVRGFGRFDAYQ